MRELMIRFLDDGEVIKEVVEERNYFLTESEQVVEKVRVRLTNEKRVSSPKKFECWIDGKKIIVTSVRFEDERSLEEQVKETILNSNWKEETKHQYINKIDAYVQKEREYLTHMKFKEFVRRFDEVFGEPDALLFPLILNIEKMKELFDGILVHVQTGFYSEMEQIMHSIREAFLIVVAQVERDVVEHGEANNKENFQDFMQVRTITWLGNETNFMRFKNYVIAYYASVVKARVDSLYPRFKPYQKIEQRLFFDDIHLLGFDQSYVLHQELLEKFYNQYDEMLFEGFAIKTDDMIEPLILAPTVKEFETKLNGLIEHERKNQSSEQKEDGDNEYEEVEEGWDEVYEGAET